jgi:hypothetical protein
MKDSIRRRVWADVGRNLVFVVLVVLVSVMTDVVLRIDRRVRVATAVAEQAKQISLSAHTRLDAHARAQGILLDDLRSDREADDV